MIGTRGSGRCWSKALARPATFDGRYDEHKGAAYETMLLLPTLQLE
jgi:hypothetical protein